MQQFQTCRMPNKRDMCLYCSFESTCSIAYSSKQSQGKQVKARILFDEQQLSLW